MDDLLSDDPFTRDRPDSEKTLPTIPDLRLFFSRLGEQIQYERIIDRLTEVYDDRSIQRPSNDFLRLFLSRLDQVVVRTKVREKTLEDFVNKVNVYFRSSGDEKEMYYDSQTTKVIVRNTYLDREIALNDLSSGEKQIISLFSRLYLYPKQKIVLIDEPELSLSFDWQKTLLPHVLEAPTCVQLFAITHSPFIFANALDPYAGPLNIEREFLGE